METIVKKQTVVSQLRAASSNVKIQKVLTFVNKKHEKRIAGIWGLFSKFQQACGNSEDHFVYYVNSKTLPLLELLREQGVIHGFRIVSKEEQLTVYKAYLSPNFDARILIVHLKVATKFGPAVRNFKTLTFPSRSYYISYRQLVKKTKIAGTTLYVLNTSKGLLTHNDALEHRQGGELVCEIQ